MATEPIKVSERNKVRIFRGRVVDISNKGFDPLAASASPSRVQVAQNSGCVDKVPIMIMVITV